MTEDVLCKYCGQIVEHGNFVELFKDVFEDTGYEPPALDPWHWRCHRKAKAAERVTKANKHSRIEFTRTGVGHCDLHLVTEFAKRHVGTITGKGGNWLVTSEISGDTYGPYGSGSYGIGAFRTRKEAEEFATTNKHLFIGAANDGSEKVSIKSRKLNSVR